MDELLYILTAFTLIWMFLKVTLLFFVPSVDIVTDHVKYSCAPNFTYDGTILVRIIWVVCGHYALKNRKYSRLSKTASPNHWPWMRKKSFCDIIHIENQESKYFAGWYVTFEYNCRTSLNHKLRGRQVWLYVMYVKKQPNPVMII